MTNSTDRSKEILDLCHSWVSASTAADGTIQISGSSEEFRLRNNGVEFHTLSYNELRAACIGLSRVLLRPGLNTVIDFDHMLFWSWCGEIFASTAASYFGVDEREPQQLFGLACRAALAETYRPDHRGWEENRDRLMAMEPNSRELVTNAHVVLVYLAFPLLEAILRKTCSAYVTPNGSVVTSFDKGHGGRGSYSIGDRCSNFGHLLWLLYDRVAGPELVDGLDQQRAGLRALESNTDPFGLLFGWRNSSLHGQTALPTIGGTVYNTAILIALDAVRADYDALREKIVERVRWQAATDQLTSGYRSPWSYYPPWPLQRAAAPMDARRSPE